MRKTLYIATMILGLFGFSSCSDYLDKESDTELTLDLVFEDKTRTEGWLANVYSGIPDPYEGFLRYEGWDILGDDMTVSERYRQWNWKVIPFLKGEWTTTSDWDGNYWASFPQRIREANIFMQNIHPLTEQGITSTEVTYMKAECRFLKAYYYSLLANTYGGVPFMPDEITPSDFKLSDLMIGQTPYDQVINWCDNELKAAAEILPAKYTESRKYGRATKIMCLAVRARMLLYAASPLVNGNSDYASYKNTDGENIFNPTYDATKWRKAADACKELIDEAEKAGHKLYVEYVEKDGEKVIDPFMSYQNMMFKRYDEGNTEILFARPGGCDYTLFEQHAVTNANGGKGGGLGVTQALVDAFAMKNGLPITDENSGYKEDGFSTSDETYEGTKWADECNGGYITKRGTYNMYCNREPRFYVTVNFNNAYCPQTGKNLNFFNGGTDNKGTHDAPQNGYLLRKKVWYKDDLLQGSYQYRPGILYRMGEAYLNYAEALNECDPGNEDILKYLNKTRERAGVRLYTTGNTDDEHIHVNLADQAEMRKLIHAERRVELCCEGLRYDDLRRWKEAETVLNEPIMGMNFNGKDAQTFYKRTKCMERVYKKQYNWFPIHQTEMDKNVKLKQAPYWN